VLNGRGAPYRSAAHRNETDQPAFRPRPDDRSPRGATHSESDEQSICPGENRLRAVSRRDRVQGNAIAARSTLRPDAPRKLLQQLLNSAASHQTTNLGVGSSNLSGRTSKIKYLYLFLVRGAKLVAISHWRSGVG
jgi:hypothetical protein